MNRELDHILDECIDRIVQLGDSVEDCLNSYPEVAKELEPYLRDIARIYLSPQIVVSSEAKDEGRKRLQAEIASLRRQEQAAQRNRLSLPRLPLSSPPRWGTALAALTIAILLSGVGTLAAAANSIPGNSLYPVKRAAEEARLAFTFSADSKADLQLTYAERRAEEISKLALQGNTSLLESTQDALSNHIKQAVRLIKKDEDRSSSSQLNARLSETATQTLASLQRALESVTAGAKQTVSQGFQSVGQTYGDAIETVTANVSRVTPVAENGFLQIRVVAPHPSGIDQLLVEVQSVNVHRTSGSGSGWVSITEQPVTFDILKVAEVQKFIGELPVEPGTYTRVQFQINKVTAVSNGIATDVKVPSNAINITRPFVIKEGHTTVLLLDFDGASSLKKTGQDTLILTPDVRVLVEQSNQSQITNERAPSSESKVSPSPVQSPDTSSSSKQNQRKQKKVEIEGVVQKVSENSLVVNGKEITIAPQAKIKGDLSPGQRITVEAAAGNEGSLQAIRIEVHDKKDSKSQGEDDEEDSPSGKEDSRSSETEIKGLVSSINKNVLVVRGVAVIVDSKTKVEGQVQIGATVHVKGLLRDENSVFASEVVVQINAPGSTSTPTPERPLKRTPTPDIKATPQKEQEKRVIEGILDKVNGKIWVVDGHQIVVETGTQVSGRPVAGRKVHIEITAGSNGLPRAVKITVYQEDQAQPDKNGNEVPHPTPIMPLPTPQPLPTPTLPLPTPTIPLPTPTLPLATPTSPLPMPTLPLSTPTLLPIPTEPLPTPTLALPTPTLPLPTATLPLPTPTLPLATPTLLLSTSPPPLPTFTEVATIDLYEDLQRGL